MITSFTAAGKTIRMSRIFKEDGRAAMVAINQGIAMGPGKGIELIRPVVEKLMPEHPDSFTIHRGFAVSTLDLFAGKAALILKSTNSTRFFGPQETPVATVQDAVMLGADAVSVGLSLADTREEATVAHIARFISEAEKAGMPTVAHAYPNGSLIDDSVRYSVESVGVVRSVSRLSWGSTSSRPSGPARATHLPESLRWALLQRSSFRAARAAKPCASAST